MSDFDEHEDDLGVEITDLDTPEVTGEQNNEDPLATTPAPGLLRPRQPVSRRQLQIAGVGIVALLLLALLLNTSGLLSAPVKPKGQPGKVTNSSLKLLSPGTVDPTQVDGLSCVIDGAWSPDGSHVIVLGYSADCAQGRQSYEQSLINIYNAHTSKRTEQVKPDKAIINALQKQFPSANNTPTIYYQNVRWSPNGQEIAVTFAADFQPDQNAPSFFGVYLINSNAQNAATVFLWKQTQDLEASYLLWDLQSGAARIVSSGMPLSYNFSPSIPTALAYQWGADGTLLPIRTTTSNSGPAGNPVGGQTFTPWQAGDLAHVTEMDNKPAHLPGIYTWTTFLTAWSPNGRYLAMLVSIAARLTWPSQPQPSHQALVDLEANTFATLPIHDRALKVLVDSLPAETSGFYDLTVAWRPDGRVLAAYNSGNIDLYDCATGKKLASLIPNQGNPTALGGATGILSWSPDGSHLLLSSATWGPLAIWGPNQLPHVP